MSRYKITIHDNKTHSKILKARTDCIVGAVQNFEQTSSYIIGCSECKVDIVICTCRAAIDSCRHLLRNITGSDEMFYEMIHRALSDNEGEATDEG